MIKGKKLKLKILTGLALVAMSVSSIVLAQNQYQPQPNQGQQDQNQQQQNQNVSGAVQTITMKNEAGTDAAGQVQISVAKQNDLKDVKIRVTVTDLKPSDNNVFEGWLVDQKTGYGISLGAFATDANGKGELDFEQNMIIFPYTNVVITEEPLNKTGPNPTGNVILSADISKISACDTNSQQQT